MSKSIDGDFGLDGTTEPEVSDEECPGAGLCHGCLKWCDTCGDVDDVCDARLRGDRCDEHPVPPPWHVIRAAVAAAEKRMRDATRELHVGENELEEAREQERHRRAYDAQLFEQEKKDFLP